MAKLFYIIAILCFINISITISYNINARVGGNIGIYIYKDKIKYRFIIFI
jgi:hypothetical protein